MAGQNNLGYLMDKGLGMAADPADAAKYYRLAAGQGMSLAKHNLALLYEEGRGVEQDYAQALTLYREAAEAGEIDCRGQPRRHVSRRRRARRSTMPRR